MIRHLAKLPAKLGIRTSQTSTTAITHVQTKLRSNFILHLIQHLTTFRYDLPIASSHRSCTSID
jgi:hypothetical protein